MTLLASPKGHHYQSLVFHPRQVEGSRRVKTMGCNFITEPLVFRVMPVKGIYGGKFRA